MTAVGRRVLIIVENLPVPFDRRVWMEATTLRQSGYEVSVICPTGKGHETLDEVIDGIHIYRHRLPPEQQSSLSYLREYAAAIRAEWKLARKVYRAQGFDLIHGLLLWVQSGESSNCRFFKSTFSQDGKRGTLRPPQIAKGLRVPTFM